MPASMKIHIDDVRIKEIKELLPPAHVLREFPASEKAAAVAFEARQAIHRILYGADDRMLVVIGPCSIHDPEAAMEYARKLKAEADRLQDDLLVVMRVYFEKPRTTVGWKGLSCPVGFKNGTDGNLRIAADAIKAAQSPHHFLSVTKAGHSAIVSTRGNEDCHAILRGGKAPNYDAASVDAACKELAAAGVPSKLMIDFSHANSRKQHRLQIEVARDVAAQLAAGDDRIMGVMVESHLKEGRQDLVPGKALEYGKSITDACIGWEDSVDVLDILAEGVRMRRVARAAETE